MKNLYLYSALAMNAIFMLFLVVSGPDGAINLFGGILLGISAMLAIIVIAHSIKTITTHFKKTKNKRTR